MEALEQEKEPTLQELLFRYINLRQEERTGWAAKGSSKAVLPILTK